MEAFIPDLILEDFAYQEIRELTSVWDCVEEEVLSICKYVIENTMKLLKAAEQELIVMERLTTVLVKERKIERKRER